MTRVVITMVDVNSEVFVRRTQRCALHFLRATSRDRCGTPYNLEETKMEVTFVCANCNGNISVEEIQSSGDWIVPPCEHCLEAASSDGYESGKNDGFQGWLSGRKRGWLSGRG